MDESKIGVIYLSTESMDDSMCIMEEHWSLNLATFDLANAQVYISLVQRSQHKTSWSVPNIESNVLIRVHGSKYPGRWSRLSIASLLAQIL